jgi:hypothetical protein
MASKQRDGTTSSSVERPDRKPDDTSSHRDAKTEARMQRPDDQRAAGRGRGDGSDDHRSGSESGKR